jgi:hypothetical protein
MLLKVLTERQTCKETREKAQRELIAAESQLELLARLARTWEISLPN